MDRQAYIDKLAAQLKQWDAEIQKLEAKARHAEAGAKAEYAQQIKALLSRKEAAQSKLQEIKEASEGAWEELQSGAEKAFDEMKRAFQNTISKFQ